MPYQMPFTDFTSSALPLFGEGSAPHAMPMFNAPLFGGAGGTGALLQMFLPALLQGLMGTHNSVPAQFLPMQGLHDQFRGQLYFNEHQRALQAASQADSRTYFEFQQGLAKSMGTSFNAATARTLSDDMAKLAPFMAQIAPDMFDALHGQRGSATVLAEALHRAGQRTLDPVTGRRGMSGASAGYLSRELWEGTFADDTRLASMRGLSAGQAGLLWEQLQIAGVGGRGIGRMSEQERVAALGGMEVTDDELRRMGEQSGRTPEQLRQSHTRLRRLSQGGRMTPEELDKIPDVDTWSRQFDAQQIKTRIENLGGVVSAMRDIFGDMGRPNAPMREVINGLQALTQGGLATMSPQNMEMTVRQTQAIARTSGLGMEAMLGLTAQAAQHADRLGLDRGEAVLGAQSSALFGAAYADVGGAELPAYGKASRDRITLTHQQLRMQAAASPVANQMNALLRMTHEGLIDINGPTEAAALARAVQNGQQEYEFKGQKKSVDVQHGDWMKLVDQAGIGGATAAQMLSAKFVNQEYGQRARTGDLVRAMQGRIDIAPVLGQGFQSAAVAALQEHGAMHDINQILAVTAPAGRQIAAGMLEMSPRDLADANLRDTALGKLTEQALRDSMKQAGMSDTEITQAITKLGPQGLRTLAATGWGNADKDIQNHPGFAGLGSLQTVIPLFSDRVAKQAQANHAEAVTQAAMDRALSGLGRVGPVRRIADAIRQADGRGTFTDLAAKALGYVPTDELIKSSPLLQEWTKQLQAFEQAETDRDRNLTPKGLQQRNQAIESLEALRGNDPRLSKRHYEALGGDASVLALRNQLSAMSADDPRRKELQARVDLLSAYHEAAAGRGTDADFATRFAVEQSVSATDLGNVTRAGDTFFAALANGTDASEAAKQFHTRAGRRIDELLRDKGVLDLLGTGGLDRVLTLEEKHGKIAQLALAQGVSAEQLLAGRATGAGATQAISDARQFAREIQDEMTKLTTTVGGMRKVTGAQALSPAERERWRRQREFREQGYQAQAGSLIEEVLKAGGLSADGKSPEGVQDLVRSVASHGQINELAQMVFAHDELGRLAESHGLLRKGGKPPSAAERAAAIKQLLSSGDEAAAALREKAGFLLDESLQPGKASLEGVRDAIEEHLKPTQDAVSAEQKTMKLTGEVALRGLDRLMMDNAIGNIAGLGSTPVIPMLGVG